MERGSGSVGVEEEDVVLWHLWADCHGAMGEMGGV